MALLLRATRRPQVAPIAAFCRPARYALLQSFSASSSAPTRDDASKSVIKKRALSRAEKFALLPPTLTAFHARYGHFIMYNGFAIPTEDDAGISPDLPPYPEAVRGLRLGTTLHSLLVNHDTRLKHRQALEALAHIGFPVYVDWERYVWEHQRLPALRVYREFHGDLVVPQSFVVPTGDTRWPIETWGLKLGRYASNIKSRDHRLLAPKHEDYFGVLKADWKLNGLPTIAERLALLAPTLEVFHAKYGHFLMQFNFVVPNDDDADVTRTEEARDKAWPRNARGEHFGPTLHAFIRSPSQRRENPDVVQALGDIGFPVDVDWNQHVFERQPLAAFRVYRELHGDCLVPKSFDVPIGVPTWPKETWGFKLGSYASKFRHSGHRLLTREQLSALAELEVSWELNDLPVAERLPLLAPTLQAFHARHGHLIMHASFTIPKEDDSNEHPHFPPYPEVARGLRLGATLHRLLVRDQSRQKYSHVLQELKEIGFPVDVNWRQYVWEHQRLAAFRVYRELHGHLRVPQSYIVPIGDTKWPIETWGFRLGEYARDVRHRYHRSFTQDQLDQLDELGFGWGQKASEI